MDTDFFWQTWIQILTWLNGDFVIYIQLKDKDTCFTIIFFPSDEHPNNVY